MDWLRRIRNFHRLTQREVAERVGISTASYSSIERGRIPSVPVAKAIAEELGFDWMKFYDGIEERIVDDLYIPPKRQYQKEAPRQEDSDWWLIQMEEDIIASRRLGHRKRK
ncbi:helix-turn-helix domain-containing protein [Kroppenstedtia eburnea]|uniref:DNA-binding transcriptional regulator, XRE-family HTH domain n=1 Tax=Kroppenstedtia eburnea TaxID=714067 RepID=A0A1N7PL69_9BACL|nr:helix-turn-helix transcriptional regulator [Kroppenstedtia eburnea]QKI83258.1 helix-turn-helix transcriptional regulator [Kroppenstedtia eburnea]SIT11306.1 DNA-binding transcriptional regulator, XRE-family HTH domain [Kroppenstedtia eburnea]